MPEFPLNLRLIGLRVTKLKDLKAEAERKASGIMKFFGAADGGGSPTKKQRIAVEEQPEEFTRLQASFEDAMPGYHEEAEAEEEKDDVHFAFAHAERDAKVANHTNSFGDECFQPDRRSDHRPRPPNSAPAPTTSQSSPSSSKPTSSRLAELRSVRASSTGPSASSITERGHGPSSPSRANASTKESNTQTCPICAKTMVTDNDGLNAHIDFCLSKEAIREAQAGSSSSAAVMSYAGGAGTSKGFKPRSISDVLSGSGKKRGTAPSGATEGSVRRKRRK